MNDFMRGAIAMGFLVAAGFFFRFWRESQDRLFAYFAAGFFLLAMNRPLLAVLDVEHNANLEPYLVRLLAYVIIVAGIVDKNLRRT